MSGSVMMIIRFINADYLFALQTPTATENQIKTDYVFAIMDLCG